MMFAANRATNINIDATKIFDELLSTSNAINTENLLAKIWVMPRMVPMIVPA